MKTGLRKLLITTNSIKSIVRDRVYITRAPQNADTDEEHIVITQLTSNEHNSLDGTSELRFLDFDIDCKATTAAKADTLSKAVRAFLKDYTGAAGDQTIEAVLFTDETDSFEEPISASDKGLYVTTLDFQIQYVPA